MSTIQTYVGNGTQTDFAFSFDYLRKEFVKVLVDGSEVAYTFHSPQTVKITPAPVAGKVIIIRRATATDRLVTFVDGSVLLAGDLNVAQLQAIHIAAEALDAASGSLLIDETGAYSAGFRRVANLGNPTASRDAVTKDWAETSMTSTLGQANAAKAAAETAAGAAQASQTAAAGSATTASTKAAEASTSAATASTKAGEAAASATAAAGSASTAATQAGIATTGANTATTKAAEAAASAALASPMPAGGILYFAGATPPSGFLKADGSLVSRSTYSALFSAIGTIYGAGDGSTTFALPDLRGEFVRGLDDGRGVDTGRALGSAQSSQNLAHTHTGTTDSAGSHSHTVSGSNVAGSSAATLVSGNGSVLRTHSVDAGGAHTHTLTVNSSGGSEARPRNIALLACIKF